jgi:hypothetical protein
MFLSTFDSHIIIVTNKEKDGNKIHKHALHFARLRLCNSHSFKTNKEANAFALHSRNAYACMEVFLNSPKGNWGNINCISRIRIAWCFDEAHY